jgi:hypothetical protein
MCVSSLAQQSQIERLIVDDDWPQAQEFGKSGPDRQKGLGVRHIGVADLVNPHRTAGVGHGRSDQRVDQHGTGMIDHGNFHDLVPTFHSYCFRIQEHGLELP